MKYINEYNSNNTYFYETDESDWLSFEKAPFNKREIDILNALRERKVEYSGKEIIRTKDKISNLPVSYFRQHKESELCYAISFNLIINITGRGAEKYNIHIGKSSDDWFLVRMFEYNFLRYRYYYKCDQLDGLLVFINNILGLKINESVSENNDKYYKSIDFHKFSKLNWSRVGLGDRETKSEKQNYFTEKEITTISNISAFFCSTLINLNTFIKITKKGYYIIYIYKLEDEWYLINFLFWKGNTHKYYMCDQLDGLVIFLNDNMGTEIDKKLSPANKSLLYFPSSKILESNTKYYRHINKEEFTKLKSNKKILFNEKEISLLNSINTDFKIHCDNNVRYVSIEVMPFIVFINKDLNEAIYIYKLDDEWYSIAWKVIEKNISSYNFYKCDQLDGLIMFLNDKIGIKRPKSINESANQNEYEPITINEADTYLSSKVVDINLSNKQLEIIYKFFSDIEMIKMPNYLNYINYVYINFQHNIIKIFEIEDEWFIVSVEGPANSLRPMGKISLFWKCDQFSGLIQFFNDYKSPFYNLHRMRESINNDMYKPIGKEPYNSIDIKKQISIDDRTFSAIDKLTQGTWGINCNKKKEIHSDGTKLTHAEIYKHIKQGKYTIKVRQHEDDWYIVSIFYESYSEDRIIEIYKCDQLDGLIKCLKDILCNI